MKSFLITAISLITLCSQTKAQGAFFNAGFGYGFPAGDLLGISYSNGTDKNVYGSYGKGLTLGVNMGYMMNENIGLDLGIWYVSGSTYKFVYYSVGVSAVEQMSGKTIRIMPCAKLTAGNNTKPYAKFGLLLGIATTLTNDETVTSSSGGSSWTGHYEWTGGSSFGWTGAFGIDFSENQTISVFAEVNFCHQVYQPALETINIAGDKLTYHLVDEPNPSASNERLKPSFPFSTIELMAGVKFSSFTKNKSAASTPVK